MKNDTVIELPVLQRPDQRRKMKILCVSAFVAALSLYVASPFVTLWTIASSMEAHDMRTLGHVINWTALDSSLKEKAMAGMSLHAARQVDELADFGEAFASTVVSNAVDQTITQSNLATVVDQIMPAAGQHHDAKMSLSILTHAFGRFTNANTFQAQIMLPDHEQETPLALTLRIEGWRWKLTAVDVPAKRQPVMEASVSGRDA